MALLPIRIYGDPVLRTKSRPIQKVDDEILAFALDMLETMHDAEGIGLAAIQVGRPIRMLVADIGKRAPQDASKIFINPEIVEARGTWVFDEGCLSIPGVSAEITRPKEIVVRYIDGKGKPRMDTFDELMARVLQHEMDHLDGKLFVDYLNPIERESVLKDLLTLQKSSRRSPAL
jgi:peptide deformylase